MPEIMATWSESKRGLRPLYVTNMKAVHRICDYADAHGIKLALIVNPVWKKQWEAVGNYSEWIGAIRAAATSHFVSDYSDLFFGHPEYFYDTLHLNAVGARRFMDVIVQDGLL